MIAWKDLGDFPWSVVELTGHVFHAGAETDGFMLLDHCPTTLLEIMQRTNFSMDDFIIFEVFSEVCMAVAHMHTQVPPLAHRYVCMR